MSLKLHGQLPLSAQKSSGRLLYLPYFRTSSIQSQNLFSHLQRKRLMKKRVVGCTQCLDLVHGHVRVQLEHVVPTRFW